MFFGQENFQKLLLFSHVIFGDAEYSSGKTAVLQFLI